MKSVIYAKQKKINKIHPMLLSKNDDINRVTMRTCEVYNMCVTSLIKIFISIFTYSTRPNSSFGKSPFPWPINFKRYEFTLLTISSLEYLKSKN